MAFKRKTSSAPSQNFYEQDKGKHITLSSGQSPVNSDGSTYDNSVPVNWPVQNYATDNENNPKSNTGFPTRLSETQTTRSTYKTDPNNKISPTLG